MSGNISSWLRRIFSVDVLGLVIAIIVGYYTYQAYKRVEPGEISLYCESKHFDESIKKVYYGFEMTSENINIMNLPSFVELANFTGNSIEDVTILVKIPKLIELDLNSDYICIEEENEYTIPQYSMALKMDKLGAMSHIPFPIMSLHLDRNEPLYLPIHFYIMNEGSTESKFFSIQLVGLMPQNNIDDLERSFIDAIRSRVLSEKNPKEIVIVFNREIVESPSNLSCLKDKNVSINHISQLQ